MFTVEFKVFLQHLQVTFYEVAKLDAWQANPLAFRQGILVSTEEFDVLLQFKQMTFYEVAKQATSNKQASLFLCGFGASVGFSNAEPNPAALR